MSPVKYVVGPCTECQQPSVCLHVYRVTPHVSEPNVCEPSVWPNVDAKPKIAHTGESLWSEALTRYEIRGASDVNIDHIGGCFGIGVGKIDMDDDEGGLSVTWF